MARASAWPISNAPPRAPERSPSRTASTPPMSAGTPSRTWQYRDLGAEHADALYRPFHSAEFRRPRKIPRRLLLHLDLADQQDRSPAPRDVGAFLARLRQCRAVRRLSGP